MAGLAGLAVVALAAGYVVLTVVETMLDWLWLDVAASAEGWLLIALVLVIPSVAGILVALLRRAGADGHSPLAGLALGPIPSRDYPTVIGAIAVTLVGGLVLGPEVAMVSTGAWLGTVAAQRFGLPAKATVGVGALAAILALFVNPLLHGSFETSPNYQFDVRHLAGAIAVGIVTAGLLWLTRQAAIGVLRLHGGDRPRVLVLGLAGLAVGAVALVYHYWSQQPVGLVLTSGESNVKALLALGTIGLLAGTVIAKLLAYAISLGGGFRGGPYFPALYAGAGIGAIATLLSPDWAAGAAGAGVAAAAIYIAHPPWKVVLILAVVLGLLVGGPHMIILAFIGGAMAKFIPEVTVNTHPDGSQEVHHVH